MAHSCPECGQTCYCNGDIDDCELEGGEDECYHCDDVEDEPEDDYETWCRDEDMREQGSVE